MNRSNQIIQLFELFNPIPVRYKKESYGAAFIDYKYQEYLDEELWEFSVTIDRGGMDIEYMRKGSWHREDRFKRTKGQIKDDLKSLTRAIGILKFMVIDIMKKSPQGLIEEITMTPTEAGVTKKEKFYLHLAGQLAQMYKGKVRREGSKIIIDLPAKFNQGDNLKELEFSRQ